MSPDYDPIYPSHKDVLTPDTKKQIDILNTEIDNDAK